MGSRALHSNINISTVGLDSMYTLDQQRVHV